MKNIILLILFSLPIISMASYEDHFPVYFEYCSGTQWKLQNGEIGGTPGHGFTYIHGLCKDYSSDYPQVVPCDQVSRTQRRKYPHEGVGISLDKNFTNVMWVAVPGRERMMFGNTERKPISHEDIEVHLKKMVDLKVFNGVISKSDKLTHLAFGNQKYLEALALDTVGTDHAVNWARELHCVRIPTPKKALIEVAKFLNESNNQYRTGRKYEWSKLSNNCVHLSLNSSHAMGLNKSVQVDQKYLKMLLNLALPANAFMMYADKAVLAKAPSNKLLSKNLPRKGFHEVQVGSLMNVYKAYPSGDYFNNEELEVMTAPRLSKPLRLLATPRKYAKKYLKPENSELKVNAQAWIERYQLLLDKLKPSQKGGLVENYLVEQLKISKKIASEE